MEQFFSLNYTMRYSCPIFSKTFYFKYEHTHIIEYSRNDEMHKIFFNNAKNLFLKRLLWYEDYKTLSYDNIIHILSNNYEYFKKDGHFKYRRNAYIPLKFKQFVKYFFLSRGYWPLQIFNHPNFSERVSEVFSVTNWELYFKW